MLQVGSVIGRSIEYVPRYNIYDIFYYRRWVHGSFRENFTTRLRAADSAAIWAIGYPVIPEGSSRTEREKGKASELVVRSWRQVVGYALLPLLSSRPARDSSYPPWRRVAVGLAIAAVAVSPLHNTVAENSRSRWKDRPPSRHDFFFYKIMMTYCPARLWWFYFFRCDSVYICSRDVRGRCFLRRKKVMCAGFRSLDAL